MKSINELFELFAEHSASAMIQVVEDTKQTQLETDLEATKEMLADLFIEIKKEALSCKSVYVKTYERGVNVRYVIDTLNKLGYVVSIDYRDAKTILGIKWDNMAVKR